MEGDEDRSLVCVLNAISIHSLRMEGDPSPTWEASKPMPFQSTPSAWRETVLQVVGQSTGHHFNPLPPHGGRRYIYLLTSCAVYFNPLPPHGGRPLFRSRFRFPRKFQSTPSAWRETGLLLGDGGGNSHFNPLPPHGGRPDSVHDGRKPKTISIHSLRMEGDAVSFEPYRRTAISIHSLRMEGDLSFDSSSLM